MKHHKAVLVEKPATLTSEEIRTLCEYSKKNHVFFMEAMKSRFIPMINQIHKEIEKGIIGDIVSIETISNPLYLIMNNLIFMIQSRVVLYMIQVFIILRQSLIL